MDWFLNEAAQRNGLDPLRVAVKGHRINYEGRGTGRETAYLTLGYEVDGEIGSSSVVTLSWREQDGVVTFSTSTGRGTADDARLRGRMHLFAADVADAIKPGMTLEDAATILGREVWSDKSGYQTQIVQDTPADQMMSGVL